MEIVVLFRVMGWSFPKFFFGFTFDQQTQPDEPAFNLLLLVYRIRLERSKFRL